MHTFSLTENATVFPFCYVFDTVLMWVSFDGGAVQQCYLARRRRLILQQDRIFQKLIQVDSVYGQSKAMTTKYQWHLAMG